MNFYLIGIDYKSAPLELREEIIKRRSAIEEFWRQHRCQQAVILSTCNRLEIYGTASGRKDYLLHLAMFRNYLSGLVDKFYFSYGRESVFTHALRLASGLESQLQGEVQITQQLNDWLRQDSFSPSIRNLWERALLFSGRVRLAAGLDNPEKNLANIVYADFLKEKGFLEKLDLLVIGSGKVAELFADYRPKNINLFFFSHKHRSRAEELANKCQGASLSLSNLKGIIPYADGLISATSSPHFVLKKEDFLGIKRIKPLYLYDLALPRDIHPQVGQIKWLHLKSLDSLAPYFKEHNENLKAKIRLAEYLIKEVLDEQGELVEKKVLSGR